MSELARKNGWRGFENAGAVEHIPGEGYEYVCDGMPTMMGCGSRIIVRRKWTTVGKKKDGWTVMFGLDSIDGSKPMDDPSNQVEDEDVVLVFCPRCTATMKEARK
jgi:hypothetical protein